MSERGPCEYAAGANLTPCRTRRTGNSNAAQKNPRFDSVRAAQKRSRMARAESFKA